MTRSEQKTLWRGLSAGILVGAVLGLILALFIAMKPEFFAALVR